MRGKAHNEEIRAQVMAALLTGQSVTEVARTYKLDTGLVSRWKKTMPEDELQQVAAKKRDRIGELLTSYVECNLTTLQVQSEHFRDTAWLKRQPASELAVLHGVLADKTIRILEAVQPAEADSEP